MLSVAGRVGKVWKCFGRLEITVIKALVLIKEFDDRIHLTSIGPVEIKMQIEHVPVQAGDRKMPAHHQRKYLIRFIEELLLNKIEGLTDLRILAGCLDISEEKQGP